jgi:hypothetical protein
MDCLINLGKTFDWCCWCLGCGTGSSAGFPTKGATSAPLMPSRRTGTQAGVAGLHLEVMDLVTAIADNRQPTPSFDDGLSLQGSVQVVPNS